LETRVCMQVRYLGHICSEMEAAKGDQKIIVEHQNLEDSPKQLELPPKRPRGSPMGAKWVPRSTQGETSTPKGSAGNLKVSCTSC